MLKAGVLYPRSGIYPLLGADFLTGIKTALAFHGCTDQIQLLTVPVDFGSNEKEVYQKTEQLLLQEDADFLIAFLDLRVSGILKPLFSATGKLLLVVNPGANYPENWVPASGTVYLTLLDSFLSRLTGMLAATNGNSRSVVAASFYDGGYAHTATMVNGFAGKGGSIVYNFISPQNTADFSLLPLQEFLLAQQDVHSLLCLFSGAEANLFYEQLGQLPNADQLQLFVSPMMLEEQNCALLKATFPYRVQGHIPWHSSLENAANTIFRKTVYEKTNRDANVFSLLGWEAGLVLQLAIANNITGAGGEEITSVLRSAPLKSPRGALQTDVSTHHMIAPVYRAGLQKDNTVVILDTLEDSAAAWAEFVKAESGSPHSGWLNTYLCY